MRVESWRVNVQRSFELTPPMVSVFFRDEAASPRDFGPVFLADFSFTLVGNRFWPRNLFRASSLLSASISLRTSCPWLSKALYVNIAIV